jgi:hypothetical protein
MTNPAASELDSAAAGVLLGTLFDRFGYSCYRDGLEVHAPSEATTRALLGVLRDVTAHEWSGETGDKYRTYRGVLPCGLALYLLTFCDEVPDLLANDTH